jgi:hypothetical protein
VTPVLLDVHGLRARLEGWPEVVASAARDFAWFARPEAADRADVVVRAERAEPDLSGHGDLVASFITPRNVVYHDGDRTIVDYFGRAASVHEPGGAGPETLTVTGADEDLVHEAVYHFLLSRTGRHLDRRGLPRLHALGLAGRHGAVAVLLPSGGGKSTLALRALRSDGPVRLLSEDSPLLDSRGRLHPFPLRIGVNPGDAGALPPGAVREVQRMEFHPKVLLDVDAFRDRVEREPQRLAHIVVGRRSLRAEPLLRRRPRLAAAGTLLREAVVGVGVYQGMEFLLQRGPADVARLAPVGLTRARCCAAGLARAQVWELVLSRDHQANWAALEPLLS